jgi:hypothetical protein
MAKKRACVKYDEDYNDSVLMNMIDVNQMHELIEVGRTWAKGGRFVTDRHREVIRRLFDQGISESVLC